MKDPRSRGGGLFVLVMVACVRTAAIDEETMRRLHSDVRVESSSLSSPRSPDTSSRRERTQAKPVVRRRTESAQMIDDTGSIRSRLPKSFSIPEYRKRRRHSRRCLTNRDSRKWRQQSVLCRCHHDVIRTWSDSPDRRAHLAHHLQPVSWRRSRIDRWFETRNRIASHKGHLGTRRPGRRPPNSALPDPDSAIR